MFFELTHDIDTSAINGDPMIIAYDDVVEINLHGLH